MAEGEGFEPPEACTSPVFKTGAFNRSAIPPECVSAHDLNSLRVIGLAEGEVRNGAIDGSRTRDIQNHNLVL
jgi:hypothetical protein